MNTCPLCQKIEPYCFCGKLQPTANFKEVLILQHPQEPDKDLGTATLTKLLLKRSVLKTALSVPNLKTALGHDAEPSRWIVLYLGSKYRFREVRQRLDRSELYVYNRKGEETPWSPSEIDGIVAIDGTWAQAKALWWRNPWLLKLRRAVINPRFRSHYGNLRREPRKECLSTIESVAQALEILGEPSEVTTPLHEAFRQLTEHYRRWRNLTTHAPA